MFFMASFMVEWAPPTPPAVEDGDLPLSAPLKSSPLVSSKSLLSASTISRSMRAASFTRSAASV
eukprot:CAMPEP_0182480166 /NCGR_PEP_ID=MMETSP1319-20130603/35351_1 /TAXON_ID=172717 /ORGANISM="Bolidomonas pacifica, Strain RCC208" /LENGTH=63 /DNA_ID=CAMNT_0024681641 /DNA_START=102 /DNA_END=293 /DNA_ORIENTATION=+